MQYINVRKNRFFMVKTRTECFKLGIFGGTFFIHSVFISRINVTSGKPCAWTLFFVNIGYTKYNSFLEKTLSADPNILPQIMKLLLLLYC